MQYHIITSIIIHQYIVSTSFDIERASESEPSDYENCSSSDDRLERGSSAVECRTRNQVSPGSNPPLVPFRRLGIFVLSINAPVDSAV